MKIEELSKYSIPEKFISKFIEEGITSLYPPQEDAIKKGVLDGKNVILSIPTASGKTFIATLAAIGKLSKKKCKVVYIVPLVALANEKYSYYKKLFSKNWKVAMSVGNLDSAAPKLADYDMIICTTEKLDSLIRHNVHWTSEIDLVIIDEIHLINDQSRGPTLELLITQLMGIVPKAQILGLSATISNSDELSDWMRAELVSSDFRPVELYEGVAVGNRIEFSEKDGYDLSGAGLESSIMENTLDMKKQAIFFVSTRRNAESLAKALSKSVNKKLSNGEKDELLEVSNQILGALGSPTSQCKKLSECIKDGTAFHHAGLVNSQKRLIEDNFRKGIIKSISATPTLAMGINLPAFRVILRDTKRYYSGLGSVYIPVMEYKQIAGRAGRPQYDRFGEAILVSKDEKESEKLFERFISGDPEEIRSKLAMEPVLRSSILALISNSTVSSEGDLAEFFSKTFYAYQYGDIDSMRDKIDEVLERLIGWNFITRIGDKILPTKIGKRVSELYLDPMTADRFITALETHSSNVNTFGLIQLVSNTIEMKPLISITSSDIVEVNEFLIQKEHLILGYVPEQWDLDFDDFMRSIKTSMFFESWMDERPEDYILRRFKVAPGEIRWRLQIADWLLYSIYELALLLGMRDILNDIKKTRVLLKNGIREEILPLVQLKGIGRVRARKLYDSGIKTIESLRNVPSDVLSKTIGPYTAYDVKVQLGQKVQKPEKAKRVKQSNLDSF